MFLLLPFRPKEAMCYIYQQQEKGKLLENALLENTQTTMEGA